MDEMDKMQTEEMDEKYELEIYVRKGYERDDTECDCYILPFFL